MQDFEEQERRLMAALGRLGAAMERLGEAPTAAEVAAGEMMDSAAEVEIARLSQLLERAQAEKAEGEARAALAQERQAATIATLQDRAGALQGQLAEQTAELALTLELAQNAQLAEAERAEAAAAAATAAQSEAEEKAEDAAASSADATAEFIRLTEDHAAEIGTLRTDYDTVIAALRGEHAAEMQRLRQVNLQLREALHGLRSALSAGVVGAAEINQSLAAEVDAMRASRASESAEIDTLLRALDPLITEASAAASKEADNA